MRDQRNGAWTKTGKDRGIYSRGLADGETDWGYYSRGAKNVVRAGRSRQEALDAQARDRLRHSAGLQPVNTRLRMRDLVEEMREAKRSRLKASSFAGLEYALDKIILPEFGHLKPAQVTADRIGRYVRELENRLKPRSVSRYLSPMNELLNRAVQHACVPTNIWTTLTSDQRPMPTVEADRHEWSIADLDAILDAARKLDERPASRQKYQALIATIVFTGARIGEVLALRWQDVDLLAETISIRHSRDRNGDLTTPKTRAGIRTIPIPEPLLHVLVTHKPENATDDLWVFPARHGEGPVNYKNFRERGFAEALKLAGLANRGITIHALRHAAASLLIDSGIPDVAVAAQLGHANANVTRAIYAHKFGNTAHDRVREAFGMVGTTT